VPIAPAVTQEVIKEYYAEALKEADGTRSRAQNGYTIAGAVAAAIAAAGIFGNIGEERDLVQAVGVVSLAAWVVAALLFIWTVAASVELPGATVAGDADTFVATVLDRVQSEHATIEKRLMRALVATTVAATVTLATLVLALTTSAPGASVHGTLSLTKAGSEAVNRLCGGTPTTVVGSIDPAALGNAFVEVKLDECGTRRAQTVRLAKGNVAAFGATPSPP
jgi:hypothetical protein